MFKTILRKTVVAGGVAGGFLVSKAVLKEDVNLYNRIAAQCQIFNDKAADAFQRYRKQELYGNISGEVIHINAGSGFVFRHLSSNVTRYIANECNPALHDTIKANAKEYGFTDLSLSTKDTLTFLKSVEDISADAIILDGGLQYEKDVDAIFDECNRILKTGGKVFFTEPTILPSPLSFIHSARASLRSIFFGQTTKPFLPTMFSKFDRIYVEDWSRPSHLFDYRSQVHTLISATTRLPEAKADEFAHNTGFLNVSSLYRNIVGGFAIKAATTSADQMFNSVLFAQATGGSVMGKSMNRKVRQEQEAREADMQWERQMMLEKQREFVRMRNGEVKMRSDGFKENADL